jgi:HEAT repeat protein
VDALIHLLADPDSNLRANAARILGQIGDARALPALEQMAQLDKARSMGTTGSLVNVAEAAKQAIEKIKSKK